MRNSIKKRFNELSNVSAMIIKHGLQLCCALIFAGLGVLLTKQMTGGRIATLANLPEQLTEAAVSVFAIVIIGGLTFDYCVKKNTPR
ncbi:hypothetical protein FACS189492_3120 [Clostridia bacterium]|nr:hypothetical protein FACS189492_3120 [Clostridia bacterium]